MDAEKYISSLNMFGIRMGLERVRLLSKLAGNPGRKQKFIHLAGTNGKGSTGAMLECALRNAGFRTGFYSSPHLIDIRERFRINGRAVESTILNSETEKLAALCQNEEFSYFEFTTILALQIFEKENCDFVIWETGMGGRLDATNIVDPEVVIITNIALDHQEHLGTTTAEIAAEKAGIIKPHVPVFHGKLDSGAERVIRTKAEELNCQIFAPEENTPEADCFIETDCGFIQNFTYCGKKIALSLGGKMQRENFRIVYAVLKYLCQKYKFDFDLTLAALDKVVWPARFQKANARTIVDGGHNPDGAAALCTSLDEFLPHEKFTVIFAAFEDKDVDETLKMLSSKAERFIFTKPAEWGRAAHNFDSLKKKIPQSVPCSREETAAEALETAKRYRERILVCGSLYLAGRVLQLIKGDESACNLA